MIADLISDRLGGDSFPAQVLGREHRVWKALEEDRDALSHLLTWDALNHLLATHRLNPPRLRLALDNSSVDVSAYCERRIYRRMPEWQAPVPHLLHKQLREGATLVLDAIDEMHPPIARMTCALERWLSTRIQVNAYASWTAKEGFGVHWDDHDVIVLQISGRKRWRIYGTTREAPLHYDVDFATDIPEAPIDEFVMEAGDILHVPRGCWHAAAASEGEPSLHLTCGLTTTTGVDFLAWLSGVLREHVHVRRDVPRFSTPVEQRKWAAELSQILSDHLARPDIVEEYRTYLDTTAQARPSFSLPTAVVGELDARTPIRLASHRARLEGGPDGTVVLAAQGRRWTLAGVIRPALEQLANGAVSDAVSLHGIVPDIPVAALRSTLERLLHDGVLTIAETPRSAKP